MTEMFLNQVQLARRWGISPRTLERWRCVKRGPDYIKIGGHVIYRLQDVHAYEAAQLRRVGSSPVADACRR
jgi:transposase-like protein